MKIITKNLNNPVKIISERFFVWNSSRLAELSLLIIFAGYFCFYGGYKTMTRKERVLEALKTGEKTNYELQSVAVGGCGGLRRARELRDDGYDIRIRRIWRDGRATGTFVYKLIEKDKNTLDLFGNTIKEGVLVCQD